MTHDFLARLTTPGPASPAGLQLLFPDAPNVPADALAAALRDYHPDLSAATVELVPVADLPAGTEVVSPDGPPAVAVGLAGWADHVVKLVLFAAPMPAGAAEVCLRPALMPPEMKAEAKAHRGHVLLYYAGANADPLEQLVAVAAVAGALARFGAVATLNEEARAAVPSFALLPDEDGEDMLHTLRTLPVPYLYGGFVKMELSDQPGVWVRTFANGRLGIPNLAYRMADHSEGQKVFGLLSGVCGYLRETGLELEPGEVVRIDEATYLRVREPGPLEWWLDGGGAMRVLEVE